MSCSCRLITARSVTLARASTRMRRLFRQQQAVHMVLQSCSLITPARSSVAAIRHKCLPVSVGYATVCKHSLGRVGDLMSHCDSGFWRQACQFTWLSSTHLVRRHSSSESSGCAEQNSNGRHGLMYFEIILRYQLLDMISGPFRNFTIRCVVEQPYSSTQADVWNMLCLKESGCIFPVGEGNSDFLESGGQKVRVDIP